MPPKLSLKSPKTTMKLMATVLLFAATCTGLADGLKTWNWRNPLPHGNTLGAMVYADGRFLAVGDYGIAMTSTNGIGWTAFDAGTLYGLPLGAAPSLRLASPGLLLPHRTAWSGPTRTRAR